MKTKKWGLVGGGKGSQIGDAHRIGAAMDNSFKLVAAALDVDAAKGKRFARSLGVEPERAYGSWKEMLDQEASLAELDLVTVATPNDTHYEITRAFLQQGVNVLCEKPLTMSLAEAKKLATLAKKNNCVLAVNFGYTGLSLIHI